MRKKTAFLKFTVINSNTSSNLMLAVSKCTNH